MKKCKRCGADLEDDVQICYGCGSVTAEDEVKENIGVAKEEKNVKQKETKKPLVFGIFSLVFSITIILGIVFAVMGLKQSKRIGYKTGKVLSIVGLSLSIAVFVGIVGYVIFSIYFILTVTKALSGAGYIFF